MAVCNVQGNTYFFLLQGKCFEVTLLAQQHCLNVYVDQL